MNKIFCIGMHKTGTLSLHNALVTLGYNSRHGHQRQSDLIEKALKLGKPALELMNEAVGEYDAYLEMKALRFHFPILDQEYVGAKFILTVRDEGEWIDSVERQINFNSNTPFFHYWYYQAPLQWLYDKRSHDECVGQYFKNRPDDLLVMDITKGDGWNKLCPFLDKDIPDEPFPHYNKSK